MSKKSSPRKNITVLKALLGALVAVVLLGSLALATVMVQRNQNVESDASVAGGIATLEFDSTVTQAQVQQPQSVRVSLDTKGALIDAAQLGIRFKGVPVADVSFTTSQTQLTLTQTDIPNPDAVDVVLTAANNEPVQLMDSTVIGTVTFTPQLEGRLELLFDPAFSKVTSRQTQAPPSPQPVQGSSAPTSDDTELMPESSEAGAPSSPQPTVGVVRIRDILQTPTGITLNVHSGIKKSPQPSSQPVAKVYCDTDAQCPSGTYCARPPVSCSGGNPSVCTSERPYCIPRPTPRPVASPAPFHDGDLNRDREVNVLDLSILMGQLLKRGDNLADLNKDGIVDITDYSTMLIYLR